MLIPSPRRLTFTNSLFGNIVFCSAGPKDVSRHVSPVATTLLILLSPCRYRWIHAFNEQPTILVLLQSPGQYCWLRALGLLDVDSLANPPEMWFCLDRGAEGDSLGFAILKRQKRPFIYIPAFISGFLRGTPSPLEERNYNGRNESRFSRSSTEGDSSGFAVLRRQNHHLYTYIKRLIQMNPHFLWKKEIEIWESKEIFLDPLQKAIHRGSPYCWSFENAKTTIYIYRSVYSRYS